MKILHLIYDHIFNPWVGGGGAVRVYEICKRLASMGHEMTILSGRFPGVEDYREGNLQYKFVGSDKAYVFSTFSFAVKAAAFVKKEGKGFDIVVEDFAPWNPVFSTLLTAKPVVLHVNHREGKGILRRWWFLGIPFYLIEKWYPRLFSHVTALSVETRRKINIPSAVIMPAGIDSSIISDEAAAAEEKENILYLGRLHIKNKGLDALINAMRETDAKLLIAGKGKDEELLKKMAERLYPNRVEFAGFVTEESKISLLKKSFFLVLPSRFEGWGIVVLEAAACGRPVIVSDIPELRYAVDAGFGLAFKSEDSADLAEKMKILLENESMTLEMGRKAREYAKNYTWDRIAEEYERYLLKVVHMERA